MRSDPRKRESGANPVPDGVLIGCIASTLTLAFFLGRWAPETKHSVPFAALFVVGALAVAFLSVAAVHRFSIYPDGIGCLILFLEPFAVVGGGLGALSWARRAGWAELDAAWIALAGAFVPAILGGTIAWFAASGRSENS